MTRPTNTPLLLGAGALGLFILAAAASSPTARRTAREAAQSAGNAAKKLEEKVEVLITDWIPTLLRKTSEHGGNYWSVQATLDGNGVSYGILQWTQKSGSLGRLLRAMAAADPIAFGRFFGASLAKLLEVTGRASLDAVDGAGLWSEPWVSRFTAAGRWPAFQQVQARDAVATTTPTATSGGRRSRRSGRTSAWGPTRCAVSPSLASGMPSRGRRRSRGASTT